jgi:hypothetical protein
MANPNKVSLVGCVVLRVLVPESCETAVPG